METDLWLLVFPHIRKQALGSPYKFKDEQNPRAYPKGAYSITGRDNTERRLWYEPEGTRKSIRRECGDHLGAGRSEWLHSHKHLFRTRCQAARIKTVPWLALSKGDTNVLVGVIHRTKGNHSVVTASSNSIPPELR